jgi:hypothetical protein
MPSRNRQNRVEEPRPPFDINGDTEAARLYIRTLLELWKISDKAIQEDAEKWRKDCTTLALADKRELRKVFGPWCVILFHELAPYRKKIKGEVRHTL